MIITIGPSRSFGARAWDHFITHVGSGYLHVSLCSAKPVTLETAINLASELELIRGLENMDVGSVDVTGTYVATAPICRETRRSVPNAPFHWYPLGPQRRLKEALAISQPRQVGLVVWLYYVLVDTGATQSIIPKQIWLSITKEVSPLQEYVGDARAANGGAMQILGGWQAVCQFDSLAVVADFLVSDIPSKEILLDFDFLSRCGAVVDLGEKTCRIMGKTFPLIDLSPTLQPQTVIVLSDTIARSEAIISGMVESAEGTTQRGCWNHPQHCLSIVIYW